MPRNLVPMRLYGRGVIVVEAVYPSCPASEASMV
jgi:hypothetical protein